jgi:Transglutaminase-like superfamily
MKWDLSRTPTCTATAFSLASIFPRRIEKAKSTESVVDKPQPATATLCEDTSTRTSIDILSNVCISEAAMQVQMPLLTEETNSSASAASQSVHLQLRMMHSARSTSTAEKLESVDCVEEQPTTSTSRSIAAVEDPRTTADHKTTRVCVHTYSDPVTKKSWVALNTSRRKFLAFLEYNNVTLPETGKPDIATSSVVLPDSTTSTGNGLPGKNQDSRHHQPIAEHTQIRHHWRKLWNQRQLITDRTELLAVYHSENEDEQPSLTNNSDNPKATHKGKRGGFRDLLDLYANRLVAILQDEQHDERTPLDIRYRSSLVRTQQRNRYGQLLATDNDSKNDHRILVKWLEDNYGMSETLMLQARRFRTLPVPAQLELMRHFLHWFRNHFPYYYDRCDGCGASQKDDLAAAQREHQHAPNCSHDETHDGDGEKEEDEDDDQSTFLGYICTNQHEELGKASRTELYNCHRCGSYTRFPRYNSAFDIIQSRRGRCGEYSLLLYRFLRALNHDARWVVDWADHVWAEVLIGNDSNSDNKEGSRFSSADGLSHLDSRERWVHLDPCEAAVDNPLLYEGWGKKQTYIVALYAPLRYQAMQFSARYSGFFANLRAHNGAHREGQHHAAKAALVEDVTQLYTTDSWENICKRREESQEEVNSSIDDAIECLERKLFR